MHINTHTVFLRLRFCLFLKRVQCETLVILFFRAIAYITTLYFSLASMFHIFLRKKTIATMMLLCFVLFYLFCFHLFMFHEMRTERESRLALMNI